MTSIFIKIIFAFTLTATLCSSTVIASENEVDRKSLTILGITPGVSKFKDVFYIFGKAKMRSIGDAGLSRTEICYSLSGNVNGTTILFTSDNEMAGAPDFIVSTIHIYSKDYPFDTSRYSEQYPIDLIHGICSTAQPFTGALVTKNGLRLGLTSGEMHSILGKPAKSENNSASYVSCIKQYLLPTNKYYDRLRKLEGCFEDDAGGWKGEPYYNICSGVFVIFKNNSIVCLRVSSGTSVC